MVYKPTAMYSIPLSSFKLMMNFPRYFKPYMATAEQILSSGLIIRLICVIN